MIPVTPQTILVLGLLTGLLSGMIGVGGGIFLIPALVYLFGVSQQTAQGTTLAMLIPPIGVFAAWEYYKKGHCDLRMAGLLCAGFVFGGFFGAKFALYLAPQTMRRVFGIALFGISLRMIFS